MCPEAHVQQQGHLQQWFPWKVHSLEQASVIPFSSHLFNILSHSCIPSPERSENRVVPATMDLQQSSGPTAWPLNRSWNSLGRALSKSLQDMDRPGAPTTDLEGSALPGHPQGGHPSASLSPNLHNPKVLGCSSQDTPSIVSILKYGIPAPFSYTLVVTWKRWVPLVNFSSSAQIKTTQCLGVAVLPHESSRECSGP